jgi:hypothetical protein
MPKILLVDIETAPNLVWMWSMWKEWNSTEMQEREWYVLCWCAKFLGEKKIMSSALIDFPKEYKTDKENDKLILQRIWSLLDEADIVIGHNALEFDIKKLNSRFIKHGMKPPSPYKIVDTCLSARKYFGFTSNKLGDLGRFLGIGEKINTGGFKLWRQCMLGNLESWRLMVKYCAQDVVLLEKVYIKLLPYIENHPNIGVYLSGDEPKCPNCGSDKLVKRGMAFTNQAKYQRIQCMNCGCWSRMKTNLLEKTKVKLVSR